MINVARMAILALGSLALCSASDIKVRLLNGKTGAPMPDQPVVAWINLGMSAPKSTQHMFEAHTDSGGVATVHLPEDQAIQTITAAEAAYYGLIPCVRRDWEENKFLYQEVLTSGAVGVNTCDPKGPLKRTITASPGEIVVFARKPNWWEAFWMRGQR